VATSHNLTRGCAKKSALDQRRLQHALLPQCPGAAPENSWSWTRLTISIPLALASNGLVTFEPGVPEDAIGIRNWVWLADGGKALLDVPTASRPANTLVVEVLVTLYVILQEIMTQVTFEGDRKSFLEP
jgi:hypothetical protein